MTDEVWKPIPFAPGYEVSSLSRIRGVYRLVPCKGGFRSVKERILKPIKSGNGYTQVLLSKRKIYLVHRIVALVFIENPRNLPQVNHKNGIRTDNRISNLEWVTRSENIAHSFKELGRKNPSKGKFGSDHSTSKAVACYKGGTLIKKYGSAMDAVREGFESSSISRCCKGKSKTHKGFRWEYYTENNVKWSEPG